ncbi:MAG TPA: patatin-like phospholipase family protein [Methylibium sp.]|uniref:patatin-like phospholipase family protein n=1 Tax=Methylibium sp. TaxID=2067992 RepID=UPI002DBF0E1F|nr:patatin-like phospholipase family protein [Methylibium sp.]HEU4457641.1 patatin-like phospholipase family protein [Methylibium sp.]
MNPTVGLVLTGGGARAAYQVGVLSAVARLRREAGVRGGNPFPVIAGTSAGAINAAALSCGADDFERAVRLLLRVWRNFEAGQVYRADAFGVIRTGARWLTLFTAGWALAKWRRARPRSLLDNAPLQELLATLLPMHRVPALIDEGHLLGLAISASSYSAGDHVTFYDAPRELTPWTRSQRVAMRASLGIEHLMASSAIPFIFPAVPLARGHADTALSEYFGDGSMRQAAPISPAVHLGAERIFVIGAGRMHEPAAPKPVANSYPSLGQIAGHALSNIFLDALAVDIERLQRINNTLALLGGEARARTSLRPIELLVIAPSQRIDSIAARHLHALPAPVRAMLRSVGVSEDAPDSTKGSALASYLLFEAPYTRELIALGEADTMARRDDVLKFFGWDTSRQQALPLSAWQPFADTNVSSDV